MSDKLDWTVMIYMAGDNDLNWEMLRALEDMKGFGNDRVKFAAQFDPFRE